MSVITTISTALNGATEQGQSPVAASGVLGGRRVVAPASSAAASTATPSAVVTLGRAIEPPLTYEANLAQSVESLRVGIARFMSQGA